MTYRERLAKVKPECLDDRHFGGCVGCPHDHFEDAIREKCFELSEESCRRCWDRESPLTEDAEARADDRPRILDGGTRREFDSGAVRDIAEGKGRCDLLPLDIIGHWSGDCILEQVGDYIRDGRCEHLWNAIIFFARRAFPTGKDTIHTKTFANTFLEVAKHYEEGAKKYAERNWEKGISLHCYIDSGVRHYLKWLRGDKDEPHDRAFVWNMLGAIWTQKHLPHLIDLPFGKENEHDS